MRLAIVILSVVFALPVSAQQQPASQSEIEARINTIAAQRDRNANEVVVIAGQAAALADKLKVAQEEIERLKKLCGTACEPKGETKK